MSEEDEYNALVEPERGMLTGIHLDGRMTRPAMTRRMQLIEALAGRREEFRSPEEPEIESVDARLNEESFEAQVARMRADIDDRYRSLWMRMHVEEHPAAFRPAALHPDHLALCDPARLREYLESVQPSRCSDCFRSGAAECRHVLCHICLGDIQDRGGVVIPACRHLMHCGCFQGTDGAARACDICKVTSRFIVVYFDPPRVAEPPVEDDDMPSLDDPPVEDDDMPTLEDTDHMADLSPSQGRSGITEHIERCLGEHREYRPNLHGWFDFREPLMFRGLSDHPVTFGSHSVESRPLSRREWHTVMGVPQRALPHWSNKRRK